MDDILEAYRTLGLPDHAAKEEVEKRYELLLRQDRARRSRNEPEPEPGRLEAIHRAYRAIQQEENRKSVETISTATYGKFKKYAKLAEKVDHAVSYYKWHAIGVITAITLLILVINTIQENRAEQARLAALPPIDLEASFIGQYYLPSNQADTAPLEEAILAQFPEWKRVEASVFSLDLRPTSSIDVAMQQKIVIQLATETPDIYFMDSFTFQWLAANGVLRSLDEEASGRWSGLLTEGTAMKAKERSNDPLQDSSAPNLPEHVYGIQADKSPLADTLPLAKNEIIIGVRVNAKHPDNALQFIERFLQKTPSIE